jgi:hypothetical protein
MVDKTSLNIQYKRSKETSNHDIRNFVVLIHGRMSQFFGIRVKIQDQPKKIPTIQTNRDTYNVSKLFEARTKNFYTQFLKKSLPGG